jgi:hypothetical protein
MKQVVVYYLVRSKLTLKADRKVVKQFTYRNGFEIKAEFIERGAGTGKQSWPALIEALQEPYRLIIARIGRLKWNPSFMRLLRDSQASFLCCDNCDLFEGTVQMQSELAQNRAQYLSRKRRDSHQLIVGFTSKTRTTDPRFKRGVQKGGKNSAKARKARAVLAYASIVPLMRELRSGGKTLDQVADILNKAGHLTTLGTVFNGPTVLRILQRSASTND